MSEKLTEALGVTSTPATIFQQLQDVGRRLRRLTFGKQPESVIECNGSVDNMVLNQQTGDLFFTVGDEIWLLKYKSKQKTLLGKSPLGRVMFNFCHQILKDFGRAIALVHAV